jgi:hypothetical protein
MALKEFISTLDEQKQYEIALTLAEKALPVWDNYTKENKPEYTDSVVGLQHKLGKDILSMALGTIRQEISIPGSKSKEVKDLWQEFSDPIIALQDSDWELPYAVEHIFYAVYNLLGKVNGADASAFDEPIIYIAINQAIDAIETAKLMTEEEINILLKTPII